MKKYLNVILALMFCGVLLAGCAVELEKVVEGKTNLSSNTDISYIKINGTTVDRSITEYETSDSSLKVVAEPLDSTSTISIEPSDTVILTYSQEVTIRVVAQNGKEATRKITVKKVSSENSVELSSITVNGVSVSAGSTYEVSTSSVTVTAKAKSSNATIAITDNGAATLSENESKTFTITCSNNGSTQNYTITVKRISSNKNVSLSSLTVNGVSVEASSINISYEIPYSATTANVLASAASSSATVQIDKTGNISIAAGSSVVFTITVTNGTTTGTYLLTVTRNAGSSNTSLSDICVNGVSVGASATTHTISSTTTTATVTATPSADTSTVTVSPSGATAIASGESKAFTISVKSQNGTTKVYTLTVTREQNSSDVSLSAIMVNGASIVLSSSKAYTNTVSGTGESASVTVTATATSAAATVTVSPSGAKTISNGSSQVFTITVTNGLSSDTYTVTVTYNKSSSTVTDYYKTNPSNQVGKNKTITKPSDFDTTMIIAQGTANDDPRVFPQWSMHENPYDAYALYAAWDSTNLYLLMELPNVQDVVASGENYPMSDNAQYWNRGTPFQLAFHTGKGTPGDGSMVADADPYVWNNKVKYSNNNVDAMLMWHSEPTKGVPGFFYTNSDGKFSYATSYCKTFSAMGVVISNKTQGLISSKLYGINACGSENRLVANNLTDTHVDFLTKGHSTDYDLLYMVTIPLASLGINKDYLETTGIGVMFSISDGGSGMQFLPYDPTQIDNAAEAYSKDESTSKEKEDLDEVSVSFAAIGNIDTVNK